MIATLGDLVDDIVVWPSGEIRVGTDTASAIHRRRGGSAANVASAVARSGGRARFVGRVGDDPRGTALTAELAADRVDVVVQRDDRVATGTIVVLVDAAGERSFLTDRGACTRLAPADATWLDGVAVLHVPGYSFTTPPLSATAADVVAMARERGIPVTVDTSSSGAIADLGPSRFLELLAALEPSTLFANRDEAELLGLEAGRPAPGVDTTVVRHGSRATLVVRRDGSSNSVPVPPVEDVVDTTGAGDAFTAGWLLAVLGGADPIDATVAGHAVAARTLRRPGADLAPPTAARSGATRGAR